MIACDLRQPSIATIDIGAAVTHVDDIGGRLDQQRGGDGCPQIDAVLFLIFVNDLVCQVSAIGQGIHEEGIAQFFAMLDGGQHALHHAVRGKMAGDAPAGMSAHTIGHYIRSEEHTSELQSQFHLVCRLLLEKKKKQKLQTAQEKNKNNNRNKKKKNNK